MRRHPRLVVAFALAATALALATGPARAGTIPPITFNPDPATPGGATTATGNCFTQSAQSVGVTLQNIQLSGGGTINVVANFTVDPATGAFSGVLEIPDGATTQTVTAEGRCLNSDSVLVNTLTGSLAIVEQATTTAATTTAATTTTPATTTPATTTPATTAAPPSTTLPITLPNTGGGSSSGSAALIGLGALGVGVGLIVLARRRSAA